jgi:hypothetical protein
VDAPLENFLKGVPRTLARAAAANSVALFSACSRRQKRSDERCSSQERIFFVPETKNTKFRGLQCLGSSFKEAKTSRSGQINWNKHTSITPFTSTKILKIQYDNKPLWLSLALSSTSSSLSPAPSSSHLSLPGHPVEEAIPQVRQLI